jgi:hypothetical protein
MSTLEQRLYDGDRAREVLENEVFQAVWADIEKDLIESWRNIPSSDGPRNSHRDAREKLHLSLTLLGKVKACVQQTMETGKLAKLELEHKRSIAQRARDAKSVFFSE